MDMQECKTKLIMLGWNHIKPGILVQDKYSLIFLYDKYISVREYGNEIIKMTYEEVIELELI